MHYVAHSSSRVLKRMPHERGISISHRHGTIMAHTTTSCSKEKINTVLKHNNDIHFILQNLSQILSCTAQSWK